MAVVSYRTVADGIAEAAHAGQVDKAGHPYIEHPRRVAAAAEELWRGMGHDRPDLDAVVSVALLHDVLEDTAVTVEELAASGAPAVVVEALRLMTRPEGEPYLDYVARAAAHPVARLVKLADNLDNADEARLALLPPETADRLRQKYADARALLAG
jgi:(p)ppGpp synthase/HD superfamily hydrolase